MTRRSLFACACLIAFLSLAAPCAADTIGLRVAAAPDPGTGTFLSGWGAPTVTPKTPLVIETTIMVNGKAVTKKVEVTGIKKWVDPPGNKFKTVSDWYDARVQAMTDASKAKAELIVAAINKAFEKEFDAIGERAKLDEPIKKKLPAYNNKETEISVVSIPSVKPPDPKNVDPKTKQPFYTREDSPMWLVQDPARESGNGGTFIPRSPGVGFRGIMGAPDQFVSTTATGFDDYGFASTVSLGIEGMYVAEVEPTPGMTDEDVFRRLEFLLNEHGVLATYDSFLKELTMETLLPGQTFTWGSTDPTLNFYVGLDTVATVPEPASLALVGTGALMLARRRQRQDRRLKHPRM